MTQQSPIRYAPGMGDAAGQLAQLRDALELVEHIAGRAADGESALDENARISAAYGRAEPVVQKRFDALAAETITWAAVAVEVLLQCDEEAAAKAAAGALADDLARALGQLVGIVNVRQEPAQASPKLPSWLDCS